MVERILARPHDEVLAFECRLIQGAAAVFADQPDRFAALHEGLGEAPEASPQLLRQIYARRGAWREHLLGEPARARLLLRQQAPDGRSDAGSADHWPLMVKALSHLWEGQVRLAESYLRPALLRVEREMGRRSSFATMLAAVLAAALWELGDAGEATALLADRLDVLERSTLPQTVVLGYCTAVRMASAAGAEGRALELLAAMDALGQARQLPRLRLLSLTEQLRLHARRYRAESCRALMLEINERLADPALPERSEAPIWWGGVDLSLRLARCHAAIAARDWRDAAWALEALVQQARARRLGRLHVESQALRAFALHRCNEPQAWALIHEAMELAEGLGLRQVFDDAHPDLGQWVARLRADAAAPAAPASAPAAAPAAAPTRLRVVPNGLLTPKEGEVLELLGRNLSNKEIAQALQVGDETIKWHVKNLLAKLAAGTRKQAVTRARVLGLLVAEG
jgi:LuxR family maltose regulon positive regulatory protein